MRRRVTYNNWNSGYNEKTRVSIHWSMKAQAYQIFFHKNGKWFPTKERFEMIQKGILPFINNLPFTEREKVVHIDIINNEEVQTWTYFIHEKHVNNFINLVQLFDADFEVDFQEKPDETSAFTSKITPTEEWLDKFKELTGQDIRGKEYDEAKSIYRRLCIKYHPDRNPLPSNAILASMMSQLNQCWTALEIQYFKTKKEPELCQQS